MKFTGRVVAVDDTRLTDLTVDTPWLAARWSDRMSWNERWILRIYGHVANFEIVGLRDKNKADCVF